MKHAKKSLLIPILAFSSIIAIAAFCYLAQSFSAYAEEEQVLESAIASEDAAASAAEEAELGQANPTGNSIMARIHFSTGDIMTGSIVKNGDSTPFGPTDVLAHEFSGDGDYLAIMSDRTEEDSIGIYVASLGGGSTDMVSINLPGHKTFDMSYPLQLNWVDNNSVDITVVIGTTYQICFDANGGTFDDGSSLKFLEVTEGYMQIALPNPTFMNKPSDNGRFVGWFTDRFYGNQIFFMGQVPEFGTNLILYAHGAGTEDDNQRIDITYRSDDFYGLFHCELIIGDTTYFDEDTSYANLFDIYKRCSVPEDQQLTASNLLNLGYNYDVEFGTHHCVVTGKYNLEIATFSVTPSSGRHINGITLNGDKISDGRGANTGGLSNYNDIVVSSGINMPWLINVTSDNGSVFKCCKIEGEKKTEFISDYVPIFVGAEERVRYYYCGCQYLTLVDSKDSVSVNNNDSASIDWQKDSYGISFCIDVVKPTGPTSYEITHYIFSDNLFTLFDGFNLNSYIKGVSLNENPVLVGNYDHPLSPGFHTFTLRMSDHVADTSVTYKANGGMFTDGSDSMTLDATYGEELPLVENPTLADNDFVGWFTEPEGGVQVDPANYQGKPGDRGNGVTLYAHWAYNPQPVPPEPVPPEPGPTPVDPDNPGGGGTAQTGDNSGIALAIVGMLALCGACGFVASTKLRRRSK